MIECLNKDKGIAGYIDGKQYLDKDKELWGYLDGNIAKAQDGYPLLILREDSVITLNEGEEVGYLKENKIYNSNGGLIYQFSKEKRQIQNRVGKPALYLKGTTREIEELTYLDFFGITSIILELFA